MHTFKRFLNDSEFYLHLIFDLNYLDYIDLQNLLQNGKTLDGLLHDFLDWSIAYYKDDAYKKIKKHKPEFFANPTTVSRLLVRAIRLKNVYVIKDLIDQLKKLQMPAHQIAQLVLYVTQKLWSTSEPQQWELAQELLAENVIY